ncbi:MAG: serine/threonine-protein kinase, partial [Lentisphaeria bacterium]
MQEVVLKDDHKRSISRVWLDDKAYVLKKYQHLHRWLAVSQDTRGWLGAHRLQNGVSCYAWYRRHDLSYSIIVYEDAGDCDLYMPQCLQSPVPQLFDLFRQAGGCIAALHRQNIFHADTKPSNFVYQSNAGTNRKVRLIDTDDIRNYWHLSNKKRARNLAQFIGCSRPEVSQTLYVQTLLEFFRGYLLESLTSTAELLALLPAMRRATLALYPERKNRNLAIFARLLKYLQDL